MPRGRVSIVCPGSWLPHQPQRTVPHGERVTASLDPTALAVRVVPVQIGPTWTSMLRRSSTDAPARPRTATRTATDAPSACGPSGRSCTSRSILESEAPPEAKESLTVGPGYERPPAPRRRPRSRWPAARRPSRRRHPPASAAAPQVDRGRRRLVGVPGVDGLLVGDSRPGQWPYPRRRPRAPGQRENAWPERRLRNYPQILGAEEAGWTGLG